MKKSSLLLILIFTLQSSIFAQKNEIKFNIASAIAGFPEVNYERLIDENITIGSALAFSIEKAEKMDSRFSFMPYSRLYFGNKKADGFFIEANLDIRTQRDLHYDNIYDTLNQVIGTNKFDQQKTCIGFGAAVGVKLISKKSALGEIYAGAGRLFGSPIRELYLRLGVSLGLRF